MSSFSDSELLHLITTNDKTETEALMERARQCCEQNYGKSVYIRALIEISNYCKNDCFYCGIRCANKTLERYRLSKEEIINCCKKADDLGINTVVLQAGEDPYFSTEYLCDVIAAIRKELPSHAITLSLGERSNEDYKLFYQSGANRYLLRHESACEEHYAKLHPASMSLSSRRQCLYNLKNCGFQVGAGFMVGSPHQSPACLVKDLKFLQELQPQMAGIGPFIPQKSTPFGTYPAGSMDLCLKMLSLARILLPKALIPATTAMGTIAPNGRELALAAGANVVMPNLTPLKAKKLYTIYDKKAENSEEPGENLEILKEKIIKAGLFPDMARGDAK